VFLTTYLANRCLTLLTGVAWLLLVGLSIAQAEGLKINSTFEGGVDAWSIRPKLPALPPPGTRLSNGSDYEDHLRLVLPDGIAKWNYRAVSPWLRLSSHVRLSPNIEVNLKLRADQFRGARVDVANIDWAPSPYLGLRGGVVNFNTNWCRTYDVDSPWMAEPDVFCRTFIHTNINNAAPGIQAYTNTTLGDYQLQTILGFYRPMFASYETKEFGFNFRSLEPGFKFNFNRKISAAVNLLHLQTGTQLRVGMMRSDQGGDYNPRPAIEGRARRNLMDNYYVGLDAYLQPTLRLRYSASKFASRDYFDDALVVQDKNKSETLELIYDWKSTDMLALGWSRFNIAAAVDDAFVNFREDDFFHSSQASWMMSWRHQWGKGLYSTLQWTHAAQTNGYYGNRRSGSGDAVGLRLGYQY
jgi:hypothetical protein